MPGSTIALRDHPPSAGTFLGLGQSVQARDEQRHCLLIPCPKCLEGKSHAANTRPMNAVNIQAGPRACRAVPALSERGVKSYGVCEGGGHQGTSGDIAPPARGCLVPTGAPDTATPRTLFFARVCHYQTWTITIFKVPGPYAVPFFISVKYKGYDWVYQQKF